MTRALRNSETLVNALADFYNDNETFDFWNNYIVNTALAHSWVEGYKEYHYSTMSDEERWEEETWEWLCNHSYDPESPNYSEIYSDIHKEYYGFRPRRADGSVVW